MTLSISPAATAGTRRDRRVIGLVGVSHGASHFYQLALPPLFPLINMENGISYAALGTLTAVFFIVSAIFQPLAGILVDRIGARRVLLCGVALMAVSTGLMGLVPYYPAMLLLSVFAAIGNSVFHPCDYSIMNATVSERRIARAFSFHMLGGYVGYSIAPIVMTVAGSFLGWQAAMLVAGAFGIILFSVLAVGSGDFRDSTHERQERNEAVPPLLQSITTLLQVPVLLCWVFFIMIAMGQLGLMTTTPTLLREMYAFNLETGGTFVSVLVIAVMSGLLAGGYLADHVRRPGTIVFVGYLVAALSTAVIWRYDLSAWQLYSAFALAGFVYGIAFPSRELLIRAACPKGASGRVFGFVYSGMDIGASISPVLFGWFADTGQARWAFLCVALLWIGSIAVILMTDIATRRQAMRGRGSV